MWNSKEGSADGYMSSMRSWVPIHSCLKDSVRVGGSDYLLLQLLIGLHI